VQRSRFQSTRRLRQLAGTLYGLSVLAFVLTALIESPALPPFAQAQTFAVGDSLTAADADTNQLYRLLFGDLLGEEAPAEELTELELWISCESASERAFALVPELFRAGLADSLFRELDDWAWFCGPAEPIFRTALLAAIWDGTFSEDLYDAGVIDHLLWYIDRRERVHVETYANEDSPYYAVASPIDDLPGLAAYDSFTTDLAYQLQPHQTPGSLEEGFTLFYQPSTQDELFLRLHEGGYAGSDLQAYYDAEVRRLRGSAAWEWSAYAGLWSPQRALSVLGRHPELGFRFGRWFGRGFIGVGGEFRFLDARSHYLVWSGDEAVITDSYTALQLALEGGWALASIGRATGVARAAIGWEGIRYDPEIPDWLDSPLIGLGLGLRWSLDERHGSRLFADLTWEWTDFSTGGGTDLDGGAWNLRVGFLQAIDVGSRERLARLQSPPQW
jgi:hypothetical protein